MVADILPLDPTPATNAQFASSAIRALIHATRDPAMVTDPAELVSTISALAEMMERLPRAFGQLAGAVETLAENERLYDDRGDGLNPLTTAMSASVHLLDAGFYGESDDLLAAAALLSHLRLRDA